MRNQIFLIFILFFTGIGHSFGQQPIIHKSEFTKTINGKQFYIHRVEHGQTLYSLSKVYEVTMDEIIFENPLSKKSLSIGQELKIPIKSRDTTVLESYTKGKTEFFYHITKQGEDFKKIASIYSVQVEELKLANKALSEPLKTGQYIKIPVDSKPKELKNSEKNTPSSGSAAKEKIQDQNISYVSKYGDNLYRLAIKFRVSIDEIKKLNQGLEDQFPAGKTILIPRKKNDVTYIYHKVLERDRLSKIADFYDVSYESVQKLNPNARNRVQSGQSIKIPIPYESIAPIIEEIPVPEEVVAETSINRDSLKCYSDSRNLLKTYKVALMIPLYLEETETLQFDSENLQSQLQQLSESSKNPFRFIQFYYGALMAVDSLKSKGLKIDLYVYDVNEDIAKAMKVFQQEELRNMDLIIGPFFTDIFRYASTFAKNFHIPIINPLSQRSDIINNNSQVFKYQPTNNYQIENVKNLVNQYYKDAKIFLIDHQTDQNADLLSEYARVLKEVIPNEYRTSNTDIYNLAIEKATDDSSIDEKKVNSIISLEGMRLNTNRLKLALEDSTSFPNVITTIHYGIDNLTPFEKQASVLRNNVVIINSEDNVFVLDVLTKLNILCDTFPVTIIGIPNWEIFENMDNNIYQNLNVHYLSSSFVDYNEQNVISFVRSFRDEFLSEPGNYAFIGFDISWYFLNALMKFGTDFEDCIRYYNPKLIGPAIKFRKNNRTEGYENTDWQVIKFNNYFLQKVKLPPVLN
ncbi:MAG: LysM peptidoglycan-binding domain-containing protein [Bacteroidetes bacterium]|nr:LysM peptidoglycan-binding domain-containing protein [Bacteroidota bacterium]